jgi:O-antigen ligase
MKTERIRTGSSLDRPTLGFLIGLAVVMLALWFPFIPAWQTFIHMWRVEIAGSGLLLCSLIYFALRAGGAQADSFPDVRRDELKFVILPIIAFITWSLLSALWAPSWKSAVHHSLIWAEYLIFYIVFRHLLERDRGLKALLTVFVLTLVLYSLPAIVEYCAYLSFGGQTTIGVRFAKYGEQVVTLMPLVLLGVVRTRGRQFAIGAAVVMVLWLLIFCSLGRANYLLFGAVIVSLFVCVWISKRYRKYAPRFALLVALLVAAPVPLHVFSLFAADGTVPALARLNDTQSLNDSNNFRKLMISVSGGMIRDNLLVGIGADNFGMQVNGYRKAYGAANPDDIDLSTAEAEIPSHAHNEFLQIAAELGVVGVAIFCWLLIGLIILGIRALQRVRSGSLYPAAAILGLGMFLASSLVSSYSFRVMQNGIVFFFVLAVAATFLAGSRKNEKSTASVAFSPTTLRFAAATAIVACVGLLVYTAVRLSSVIITARANQTQSVQDALPLYELAMMLDDENPDARHNLGMRIFRGRGYARSVPYLESAILIGRAPSAELSYLATAQSLSGDPAAAEATMKMASELYPRSPFVLTRYSTLLESHGKHDEAGALFNRAKQINERAAITWRAAITRGPKALSEMAARDSAYMHVMELTPQGSIYAVITERFIRFPEEQRFSLFKAVEDEK